MQRLTFVAKSDNVELVSRLSVEMKPVPGHHSADALHDFWLELRDANDRALHVGPAPDPFRREIEVFSDDPARSASRSEDTRSEHYFSVLVPQIDDAAQVVLMRRPSPSPPPSPSPARGIAAAAPVQAIEVARIKL